jgi:tRNA threonylcarbamoyladenosine biosynthesis protein TsaE
MVYAEAEIREVAKHIIKNSNAQILCFYGQMGAGKTTLIKALVDELGGGESAKSPTFGIVNEYHTEDHNLLGYHFDFYRLNDENEALDLGFEDYLNKDVWLFIEWPEKISSFLPKNSTNIHIQVIDEQTRRISF